MRYRAKLAKRNMANLGDDSLLSDAVELRVSQQMIRLGVSDQRVAKRWLNTDDIKAVAHAHRCHVSTRDYRCWFYTGCCLFASCWILVVGCWCFFLGHLWVTFGSPLGHLGSPWVTLGLLWDSFGIALDDPSKLASRIFRGPGLCKLRGLRSIQKHRQCQSRELEQ